MSVGNNRRSRRVSVENVTGSVMFSYEIFVQNISVDGIAFRTSKRLQINKVYLLKIPCGKTPVPVRGEVVWCTLSGSMRTPDGGVAPLYSMGMRFVPGQEDRLNTLKSFIDHQRKEERLFSTIQTGITLSPGSRNEFSLPERYPVIKISQEEVVVETDTELSLDARIQLEIHLSEQEVIFPVGKTITNESVAPGKFRATVQFTQITEKDEAQIRRALNALLGT